QHDQSFAPALGCDQRCAISKRRPGAVGELRVRLRQHLPRHRHIGRNRYSVERAFSGEGGERLRFVPAQTAAQYSAAAAQFLRYEIIVSLRKMRSDETQEDPAIVDPYVYTFERVCYVADIGKDQHWQMPVEESHYCFCGRYAFGKGDIGEWVERAGKIVGRANQRLRTVGSRTRNDTDGAPTPALVEQLNG